MHAIGIPYEIRTRVNNVKGWCPGPLDERDILVRLAGLEPARTRREILSLLRLPITPQSHYLVE